MSTHVVRWLIRWLRGTHRQERDQRRGAAAQRLAQAKGDVRKWKARHTHAIVGERAAVAHASVLGRQLGETERRLRTARREAPSVDVLRETFSLRKATLAARVGARALQRREERLLGASMSYRSAIKSVANSPAPGVQKLECEGLSWWVPGKAGREQIPSREVSP